MKTNGFSERKTLIVDTNWLRFTYFN